MKTVKTCELIGPALDWAVSKSEGDEHWTSDRNPDWFAWRMRNWKPSTDWAQGGPLIEKYGISISSSKYNDPQAWIYSEEQIYSEGPAQLIAAMRAIALSKLGDTVQIPDELWTAQNDTAPISRPDGENARASH